MKFCILAIALMLVVSSAKSAIWISTDSASTMPTTSLAAAESTCTEASPCLRTSHTFTGSCDVRFLPGDYSAPTGALSFPSCSVSTNITFVPGGYYAFPDIAADSLIIQFFGAVDYTQMALNHPANPDALASPSPTPETLTTTFPSAIVRNTYTSSTHALFIATGSIDLPASTEISNIVFYDSVVNVAHLSTVQSCAFMVEPLFSTGGVTITDSLLAGATNANTHSFSYLSDAHTNDPVVSINSDWLAASSPLISDGTVETIEFYSSTIQRLSGNTFDLWTNGGFNLKFADNSFLYNANVASLSVEFHSSNIIGSTFTMPTTAIIQNSVFDRCTITVSNGNFNASGSTIMDSTLQLTSTTALTADQIENTTITSTGSLQLENAVSISDSTISVASITAPNGGSFERCNLTLSATGNAMSSALSGNFTSSNVRLSAPSTCYGCKFMAFSTLTTSSTIDMSNSVVEDSSVFFSGSSGTSTFLTAEMTRSNITAMSSINGTGTKFDKVSLTIGSAQSLNSQRFDCASCQLRNSTLLTWIPMYAASLVFEEGFIELHTSIEAIGGSFRIGELHSISVPNGLHNTISVSDFVIVASDFGNGSLVAAGYTSFTESTNLVIEHVALASSTTVLAHIIDLQRSVSGQGSTSSLQPYNGGTSLTTPIWTIRSINIDNARLQLSSLPSLTYKHDRETGIVNSDAGNIVTSISTVFLVDWAITTSDGSSTIPQLGENYTMIARPPADMTVQGRTIPFQFYRLNDKLFFRIVPVSPPTAPPCVLPAPTSPSFICVSGKWISSVSVNTSSLFLPRNAGNITVEGDLVTSSIFIDGLGTTLIVTGCNNSVKTAVVSLSDIDLDAIGRDGKTATLARFGSDSNFNCESSPAETSTLVIDSSKTTSCRRASASKDSKSKSDLVAVFSIDDSKCNVWWIVLASVLGGVVIVVIIIAIAVRFVPSCKALVRPFKNTDGGF